MNAVQETTVWADKSSSNHIYLMDGNNAVAYIRKGSTESFYFKKPITLDTRGRVFKPVFPSPFKNSPDKDVIEVSGSTGQTYFVNTVSGTCTCPGFIFRGKCKHTAVL